ncbi:alpha/beta fold hydrolase [Nocardia sp. NPDC020380]|uniref:alpha/beta fold hydrolase n=1 Tax=Nocardia sp. NPDC020380 TaxID=3364309 RepID=UPI00378EAA1E
MTSTSVPEMLSDASLAASLPGGFTSRLAEVGGVRLHYVDGGAGAPLLLLGGWPQTWWQWHKVMPALAQRYRVIAVDLRGMGGSGKPAAGYDKKTMAADIRALVTHLGLASVSIAGHDIGAMVAYAYAANYPGATEKIALLDVPHPDEGWPRFGLLPEADQHVDSVIEAGDRSFLWWFAFNQVQELPELLLGDGRIRLLIDWLFTRQARNPAAIDEHSLDHEPELVQIAAECVGPHRIRRPRQLPRSALDPIEVAHHSAMREEHRLVPPRQTGNG